MVCPVGSTQEKESRWLQEVSHSGFLKLRHGIKYLTCSEPSVWRSESRSARLENLEKQSKKSYSPSNTKTLTSTESGSSISLADFSLFQGPIWRKSFGSKTKSKSRSSRLSSISLTWKKKTTPTQPAETIIAKEFQSVEFRNRFQRSQEVSIHLWNTIK